MSVSISPLRIGVDIGGTFTDFVIYDPGRGTLETFKLLSTPSQPAQAVLLGLNQIVDQYHGEVQEGRQLPAITLVHGSTVATNALLERKGARTALVTTRGFRDVLQIGRQNRPSLYDWFSDPLPPLVPEELRFEVDERVAHSGAVIQALQVDELEVLVARLQAEKTNSVAVCLLFSFLNPQHEQLIAKRLAAAGLPVSLSSEIIPEYREYERTSTTVINAYVSPVLGDYLSQLEHDLVEHATAIRLQVMQSNGGIIHPGEARRKGVHCILSGPAGGVIGCQYAACAALSAAQESNGDTAGSTLRLLTFDMGGTSTDVSLIDGQPQVTSEALVGGYPIRIPLLDIHTIGAGGGSIARLDAGGALRVGPHSAGADPGPACYGRGNLPTVTDANLALGRLDSQAFLGGKMPLDVERALEALATLGMDAIQAALGIVQVANAHMERALRVISVERGHDPRRFTLLSFGGAGGLHAADLARSLGMKQVLAPPLASTLSAFGMLAANVVKDTIQTVMLSAKTPLAEIEARLLPLEEQLRQEVLAEGIPAASVLVERFLDLRYQGQSYELTAPFSVQVLDDFHQLHSQIYGYSRPEEAVEIVNLRLRVTGLVTPPPLPSQPWQGSDPSAACLGQRLVHFAAGALPALFYQGELLLPGNQIAGPAVILRSDTTLLLAPQDQAQVDSFGNLWIQVGK